MPGEAGVNEIPEGGLGLLLDEVPGLEPGNQHVREYRESEPAIPFGRGGDKPDEFQGAHRGFDKRHVPYDSGRRAGLREVRQGLRG